MSTTDAIYIADAPLIPGLAFRHFRGVEDYPKKVGVSLASAEADKIERADSENISSATRVYEDSGFGVTKHRRSTASLSKPARTKMSPSL